MSVAWTARAALVSCACLLSPPGLALELLLDVGAETAATSNVFGDQSQEWDLALRPNAALGVDFADFMSAGYTGAFTAYLTHAELLSYWHRLYLYANPTWGDQDETELVLELFGDGLHNSDAFRTLDHLRPGALAALSSQIWDWLRGRIELEASYRWYYADAPSDSLDTWLRGEAALQLPWRMTLIPSVGYGVRLYTRQDQNSGADVVDQQLLLGARLGQALWHQAGLQLDYGYRQAIGASGLLTRKLTDAQFAYVGDAFFFSGHRGLLALRQILGDSWSLAASFAVDERVYHGWLALDANGGSLDRDRHDVRLGPRVQLGYVCVPADDAAAWLPEAELRLEYAYTYQWSNSDWYHTQIHGAAFSVVAAW